MISESKLKRCYREEGISKNQSHMNFQIILSSDPVSISALHFVITAYVMGELNLRIGYFDSHRKRVGPLRSS